MHSVYRTPACSSFACLLHLFAGLLVPDIPLEETVDVRAACNKHGIELVLLATPTTPVARMESIAKVSQGFVYLVSVTGVTGIKENMESRVQGLLDLMHSVTDKPVGSACALTGRRGG